ncbi:MAG: helix-turn-helix transcriptional regulator [Alphaproteobacteria bacterium]|nr:helix-turn-helix transcriptional regulator [Alphaproteobacteria bacterium]MBV8548209.1 helix-turn-helix transcriptional regulator [Alphaproteobacteria bacterium]
MTALFTPAQIRAARALLNWSRSDLAAAASVSEPTLHRIENSIGTTEIKTQKKLRGVLEAHGIEFGELEGVRRRAEDVRVLSGIDGFNAFWDEVYNVAVNRGGWFRQNAITEKKFFDINLTLLQNHVERMTTLFEQRKNVGLRVLAQESSADIPLPVYAEFRAFPTNVPLPVPYYVFGGNVAIFAFDAEPSPRIIIIKSPPIAEAYAAQFDAAWGMAKKSEGQKEVKIQA